MSAAAAASGKRRDPHKLGHGEVPVSERGPAPKRIVVAYGFWIFLLSDIIMFSAFFAAYAVLGSEKAGGPTGGQLFEMWRVALETVCLLASSFTAGLASVAANRRRMVPTQAWLLVTGLLGLAFLVLEVQEFYDLVARGAGPGRSAFLSAFFALVGCHGLHVTLGLVWLTTKGAMSSAHVPAPVISPSRAQAQHSTVQCHIIPAR